MDLNFKEDNSDITEPQDGNNHENSNFGETQETQKTQETQQDLEFIYYLEKLGMVNNQTEIDTSKSEPHIPEIINISRLPKSTKNGYVYFIYEFPIHIINEITEKNVRDQIIESHVQFVEAFKIGESDNPTQRCKTLQTGNMRPLKIYRCIECQSKKHAQKIESMLHRKFSKRRILNEWFSVKQEEIDLVIAEIASTPKNESSKSSDVRILNFIEKYKF